MEIKKRNIFLTNTIERVPYGSRKSFHSKSKNIERDVKSHAKYIRERLEICKNSQPSLLSEDLEKDGKFLEFSGAKGYDLAFNRLENRKKNISLLNVKKDDDIVKATVFLPNKNENYYIDKVEEYGAEKRTKNGNIKNSELLNSIEDVKLADLNSFWLDSYDKIPKDQPKWCEVWLRYSFQKNDLHAWKKVEESFVNLCRKNNISINEKVIVFPERIVKNIFANEDQLKLIIDHCDDLAELHQATEVASFFKDLLGYEQKDWVEELLSRTTYDKKDVAVCLLDTGLTMEHPLINPATESKNVQAVENTWSVSDWHGHGTEMAGCILFNNLQEALESNDSINVPHQIESVKILERDCENKPELYGAITRNAITKAEIENPFSKRVICMAVTGANDLLDGSPTSWSASIDSIVSGAEDEDNLKRIFLVSAGNVNEDELSRLSYPEANLLHSVENPGQSWNAITIGAYTKNIKFEDDIKNGFYPLAAVNELSPYSSTSVNWSKKWPVKPEVLFDGGNAVSNGNDCTFHHDLSILTTNNKPFLKMFSSIFATSSATAQASWFCANVLSEYPDIWPETVRGLMIHSASWTKEMKKQFCKPDKKSSGRKLLLRTCGYGVPDLERAIQCMNNSVNMIIQGELQPFKLENGSGRMNEMHFHLLPWPGDVLRELGDASVTLKITLSYYIEPGPGQIGWKNRYKYPSAGLRFDLINSNETEKDFKKRINKAMNDDEDDRAGSSGSERWYLGSDNRDVGSIHSDFIICNAVDLCTCNLIAVYPVSGWWKDRAYLGKANNKMRYSLIVSISSPETDVDLYSEIITQIHTEVEVKV